MMSRLLAVKVGTGLAFALLLAAPPLRADQGDTLNELTLEQLLDVEVISVSRRAQRLAEVPSAVYVITADAIRRGGFTSVPEALRLAPGVHVARQYDNQWAISARGFENTYANKLLVLIDGRIVYSQLFSGTFWETQTPPLGDIDRIEVIRGPGATIWGPNAVNGVINVITRSATQTEGTQVMARAGNEEQLTAELSHTFGGSSVDAPRVRVSTALRQRDQQVLSNGDRGFDDNSNEHLRLRADWQPRPSDELSFDAGWLASERGVRSGIFRPDYSDFRATLTDVVDDARTASGGLRWKRTLSERASLELSALFDRQTRSNIIINERRISSELNLQHTLRLDRHHAVMGLNWRRQDDRIDNSPSLLFLHTNEKLSRYGGFLQDEIDVGHDVRLTLGSKLSWETYTGWDAQPSARITWQAAEHHLVWGAVSRAIRTPSRFDRDGSLTLFAIPGPTNTPVGLGPNPDFDSEVVIASELGYRVQPLENVSLDVALFANDYENIGVVRGSLNFRNRGEVHSSGAEVAANWIALPWLHFSGSWTTIHLDQIKRTPHHEFQLHGSMDLPHGIEADLAFFYQGRRRTPDANVQDTLHVGSFSRVDLRLGWTPREGLELSLVGQDLLDRHHEEFVYPNADSSEIERSVYAQAVLRF